MIKAIKVNWEHSRLAVETDGKGCSPAFEKFIWHIGESNKVHFKYIGLVGVRAEFNPRDGYSVLAVNRIVEEAEAEKQSQANRVDIFDHLLAEVKKENSQHAYRTKKKRNKATEILAKLDARVRNQNYKARKDGLPATLTLEEAEKILKSAKGKCPNCGAKKKWYQLELAHIKHHADGGGSTADNTQPMCGPCNKSQGAEA